MFKIRENPSASDFGKFPRSMKEAFKGVDYGCAIEVSTPTKKWLKMSLNLFPKVIWVVATVLLLSILINVL